MPKKKRAKHVDIRERINEVLTEELEIEREEDLRPKSLLADFPGYDEDWTSSYLIALLEKEFEIDLPDELAPTLTSVQDVYDLIEGILKK